MNRDSIQHKPDDNAGTFAARLNIDDVARGLTFKTQNGGDHFEVQILCRSAGEWIPLIVITGTIELGGRAVLSVRCADAVQSPSAQAPRVTISHIQPDACKAE